MTFSAAEAFDLIENLLFAHPHCHARPDDASHAGAHYLAGDQPLLLQVVQHAKMRDAQRPAAGEHQ